MSFLDTIFSDLREKRLWPAAMVLVVALAAVPVLLPKKTKLPPVAQATPLAVPVTQLSAVPAVSIQTAPTVSNLKGSARDPFTQPKLPSTTTTTNKTSTTGSSTPSTSSAPSTSAPSTPPSRSTTPATSTTPSSGVTYLIFTVDLVLSKNSGHPSTLRDITRLTPIPSSSPFLVYLGVKTDHSTVAFLVSSRAKPAGQGKCIPTARQCEFLDLKLGQQEAFLVAGSNGHVDEYVLKLTAIRLKTTTASGATTLLHSGESSVAVDLPAVTKSWWFGYPAANAGKSITAPGH